MKTLLFPALFLFFAAVNLPAAPMTNLQLTSGEFTEGGSIPRRFTCDGRNENPSLRFTGLPERTRSLAVILDDPDAPGGLFTHWLVWNVPPETTEFITGTTPNGVSQGTNDFGKTGYGGPCPPSGEHRYVFHLYALDTTLTLPAKTMRRAFDAAIKGHLLGEAKLMGHYSHEVVGK